MFNSSAKDNRLASDLFTSATSEAFDEFTPYNLAAQSCSGESQEGHERFFKEMLAEVEEPTLPFGLGEFDRDGFQVTESHRTLQQDLNDRLRAQAKRLNVSLASLCHLAWAQVIARISGQPRVVFGTVLFGRAQAGTDADQALGLFINTLPLRIDLDKTGVEERARDTHARLAALIEHEHASLALARRCSSVPDGTPLFSALLNYVDNAVSIDEGWVMPSIKWSGEEDRASYPFVLTVDDFGTTLGLIAQVLHPFDPARMCDYMQQALQSLVDALEHTPNMPVHQLEVLPFKERELLLQTWNATATPYPPYQSIHQLFEKQVERTPEATALVYGDQQFSYVKLNTQANRLAHQLIELGVQPDIPVAICVERSPAMVVGLLAILKAGGAYVPLDPAYPSERLTYILTDVAPTILLADAIGRAAVGETALNSLTVLDPNKVPSSLTTNPLVPTLTSRHLAYVIYTSGSTGKPKGVMVMHRGLNNYLNWAMQEYAPKRGSVVSSSLSFDATVTSLWAPLLYGSRVLLLSEGKEVDELEAYMREAQGEGLVKITPAHLEMLGQRLEADGVKTRADIFVIGGEALNPATAALWQRIQPDLRLINEYGPTETVVGCVAHEIKVSCAHSTSIPIGRPIANTRLYLLDAYGQPMPLGAVGELYIGGAGVARGYLNRPELTAERFLTDPFVDEADARMYRTGDLARYLPDGSLEYLGRNDHQMKIRGFRIEPGEIEVRLVEHPLVREALVLALGEANDKRLIAYVVAEPNEELAQLLRAHVSAKLPEYMVPAAFVRLDVFPLTSNGKVDRRALPAPDGEAFARQAYAAPEGELEITLAALWSALLGVGRISRHDSFFALGGHSLLAVQMIERLRRSGLTVSVRALFDTPTLSALAQTLGQHHEVEVPPNLITPDTTVLRPELLPLIDLTQADIDRIVERVPGGVSNIQDLYALSPLQDGILFHHLLATEGDPYLLITKLAFSKRKQLDRYLEAVQLVVNRHDILRTAFIWEGISTPAQVVLRQASLSITELTLNPEDGPVLEQLSKRFDPGQYRLDLTQAPLLHFIVARDGERWLLLELQHHLIGDHATLEIMCAEIRAFLKEQGGTLPSAQPFRNLIAQTRLGQSSAEHERFFTEMLSEVDEPTLPFGLSDIHRDGVQVIEAHRTLSQDLNDRLRAQAKRLGVSLASLCHLAWAQVLARASGQQRVVFGTVLLGRMQAGEGADSAMGLFMNTLPLCVEIGEHSVEDSVRHMHARLAGLLEHEHASLALAQRCSGIAAGTPLFSALLNYRHNLQPLSEEKAIFGIEILSFEERTNYPLILSVEDGGNTLGLTAQAVHPLEAARVCSYMQTALESLLEALEHAPEMPVQQLKVLPKEERTLLLKTWNATATPYPAHQCIHQVFEAQVARTPDAIAVVYEKEALSYAELNARANGLAYQLIKLGVKPDTRVALCVQRSPAMVIGLLAVLKAGGAYVPLDATYLSERLIHILDDAAPTILLADAVGRAALGEAALAPLTVIDPNQVLPSAGANPHIDGLTSRHLAYLIYTSGSTGRPKGVMVEHHSLLNLYTELDRTVFAHYPTHAVMSLNASFAFDASWKSLLSLLKGYTLAIVPQSARVDGTSLLQFLQTANINILDCTPSQLEMLLSAGLLESQTALTVLVGGEPISIKAWQTLAQAPQLSIYNVYGPTECTVDATIALLEAAQPRPIIGRPVANTRLYLLDAYGQPVPLGAVGELYIGGVGVARGYLNRPELTAERFLTDPFVDEADARMYKTGDLVRYLFDGNLEFLGRNDFQVKIRGFRIELGEIEARLAEHPQVREAAVLALGEGSDKRLVAYVVAEPDDQLARLLRAHLAAKLPDYMVPAAFVRLDAFPLTPNGKLDRRAFPTPDETAFARQVYEAPQGAIEILLASIWTQLLKVEQVSRHDNFFALGGHSLFAVQMIERLRRVGLTLSVRILFDKPTLSVLAQSLGQHQEIVVPPNLLTRQTTELRPELLPLIQLTQADIDRIVEQTPGGVANIQDIYALSPLQDGILFHHLMATEGDPYLLISQLAFDSRALLDRYLAAVQQVVKRHDILRTAFVWERLSVPAQVVWRDAPLSIEELSLNSEDGSIVEQLLQRFDLRRHRIDLTQAPLLRFAIAQDNDGRWLLVQLMHHLIGDHSTREVRDAEVQAIMEGESNALPPAQPFRNLVAQARLRVSQEVHERFFSEMLAEIEEPTLPFGLSEVYRDGSQVTESHRMLPRDLNDRLRAQAKRLNVSLASLCHLAWAQVLSRTSGQQQVVFGTVLFGRMQGGAGSDRAMGLFINTLPLRIDVDETGVEESVCSTHTKLAALLEHEHASLALAQRCSSVSAGMPLFSALLNYRHNAPSIDESQILPGIKRLSDEERTNYPLMLSVEDDSTDLGLTAQVMQPIDPVRVCGYMQQALQSLVEALEHTPKIPVHQLEVLPFEEREFLLQTWNATAKPYSAHQCIHQLFEEQVERTPKATALVFEDQEFSYAELNTQANRLAYQLIELGVQPDTRVAICVKRSPAMVIALLAILKVGGVYLPLDPVYPRGRLTHILDNAAPRILLADTDGRAALGEEALARLTVLDPNRLPKLSKTNPQIPALTSRHLAYVLYTSGSTGMPKGVMMEHQSIVNLTQASVACFEVDPSSRVLQLASISFDVSIWEVLIALSCGASLYLAPEAIRHDRDKLWDYLARQAISHVILPPALLQEGEDLPSLSTPLVMVLTGDAPSAALLQNLNRQGAVFNAYGPTETHAITVWSAVSSDTNRGVVSIGRPITNTQIYVLDVHGRPVPLGAVGELYIAGVSVARGYLNRPELTAERFLRDPFSEHKDAKMYKTGDLVRYLPDGNLIFLGRNDHQIKIRGFRIEPGEIEARLAEHPQVCEAAVLALGEGNDKRLVAYVVAEPDDQLARLLRVHLAAKLPEYMVPAAFVRLDAFPLTPNGKLDRRALPTPDETAFARQVYEAPQGAIEILLAGIWVQLLKVEQVGRHDNFFALGGHSLFAVQMIERLRCHDLALSVRDLFDKPTLSVLAKSLRQDQEVVVPPNLITPNTTELTPKLLPLIDLTQADIDRIVEQTPGGVTNIQDIYALSPLQDGILFHHLMANEGDPYLGMSQMAFVNRALLDRYLKAVAQVVQRHDILRTAFVWKHLTTSAQVVWRDAPLSIEELSLDPADGPIAEQLLHRFAPHRYRIDLTQAPLLRFVIAQDDDGRWLLIELLHHLISDNASRKVMDAEVRALMGGEGNALLPAQPFRNLVAQARLRVSQEVHERFFSEMLAEVEEPTLPFGLSKIYYDGSQAEELRRMLPQNLNDRLRAQAKRLNVSLASLCHLAWAQVLSRTSGQQQVVFGTVLFGRMQGGAGSDRAMGLFINTLPLRIDVDETGVEESVCSTHTKLAALLEHEHASLALAQRCSSVSAGTPLFNALLNYRHNALSIDKSYPISGFELLHTELRDNYPLSLSIDDSGQSLEITAEIVPPFDPEQLCGYVQKALESLVQALEHAPQTPVRQLEIVPDTERLLLLQTWNATAAPYPQEQHLHQLFEAQVERAPDAIALIRENQTISYAELNAQANRLAHHLIDLGVTPDSRVALYAQSSIEMVMGMLAVLKAGGAYVPLDAKYPAERLTDMVTDSAPVALLSIGAAHADVVQCLGEGVPILDLRADLAQWKNRSNNNPDPQKLGLNAEHLAYVMYTSGSTGKPKGVMIHHRGVVNIAIAIAQKFDLGPQARMLQFASLSFDGSVHEIFAPLTCGATVVLRTDAWLAGAQQFWSLCEKYRVNAMDLPTQFWAQLVQEEVPIPRNVRAVMIGGDALTASSHRTWFARVGYRPRLLNGYGPTETTVLSTFHEVSADSNDWRTIGRPFANTKIYILDSLMQLSPGGAVGELYIGGVGAARGYLNRPDLTAERFLPDPFSDQAEAWMYKTGDLVRYLPNGNLEFLGRNDHQVKIRGFRVEPGEIEARLGEHPQVREAVVVALGEGGGKHLVAYVAAESDEQLVQSLHAHVAARLPEYMMPAAFVRLDTFPFTPNGKVDRKALPVPDAEAFVLQEYEAPQGEIEHTLAEIWSELLGIEHIGRHDSFFVLGGHSLLAMQMASRIRSVLDADITLRALFEAPTIAGLAQSLFKLDGIQHNSFDVLLPLQPKGSRPPLFCIHTGMGLSWSYVALSQYVGSEQPIYGLQARGLDGVGPVEKTIDAMAADYIEQIRRIQPKGPYHLLGWSFGGSVAHCMATQLEQQGEKVALLAIWDTYPPLPGDELKKPRDMEVIRAKCIDVFNSGNQQNISDVGEYLWTKTRDFIVKAEQIAKSFSPRIYSGDMLFFRATIEKGTSILLDPATWKSYVLGNIEAYDICCEHDYMDRPIPIAEIGRILADKLNQLQESQSPQHKEEILDME